VPSDDLHDLHGLEVLEVLESAPSEALKGRRQDYCEQMPSSNIVAK